jgi:hypothetical protein
MVRRQAKDHSASIGLPQSPQTRFASALVQALNPHCGQAYLWARPSAKPLDRVAQDIRFSGAFKGPGGVPLRPREDFKKHVARLEAKQNAAHAAPPGKRETAKQPRGWLGFRLGDLLTSVDCF